jgi:hypothetical protein
VCFERALSHQGTLFSRDDVFAITAETNVKGRKEDDEEHCGTINVHVCSRKSQGKERNYRALVFSEICECKGTPQGRTKEVCKRDSKKSGEKNFVQAISQFFPKKRITLFSSFILFILFLPLHSLLHSIISFFLSPL